MSGAAGSTPLSAAVAENGAEKTQERPALRARPSPGVALEGGRRDPSALTFTYDFICAKTVLPEEDAMVLERPEHKRE
jgi:hypothetical protein